jgi:maleate isomerase
MSDVAHPHVPDLPLRFDPEPVGKRIGLVLLSTDHTAEVDFARMVASPRVGVYATRVAYENPTTPENLRLMQPRIAHAAGLILPGERLDALVYACTSASAVIGEAPIMSALHEGKPGTPAVTPTLAAAVALRALGARRVSLLLPYTVETSLPMARFFQEQGFVLDGFSCLGIEDDRQMARLDAQTLIAAARTATSPTAEALFVSCTAVRAAGIAAEIEAAIGRPLVSSNLATAWACARLVDEPLRSEARLAALPLAEGSFPT